MKKLFILILAGLLALSACARTSPDEKPVEQGKTSEQEKSDGKDKDLSLELNKEVEVKDFLVTVKDFKVVKDSKDNNVIALRITYDATYTGENEEAPTYVIHFSANQDGEDTHIDFRSSDDVNYGPSQETIKKGETLTDVHDVVGINDLNKALELKLQEKVDFEGPIYKMIIEDLSQYQ